MNVNILCTVTHKNARPKDARQAIDKVSRWSFFTRPKGKRGVNVEYIREGNKGEARC